MPEPVPDTASTATVTEAAMLRLRADILAGALPPATPLRLRALTERYGIGATPLREALSRLAAEGVVVSEGQRGFSVPPVTRAHLLDITRSRQVVEPQALRLAMRQGGSAWEDEIVTGFHLLKRELERRVPSSEAWLDAYEAKHHRFHRALIAACPLQAIKGFCDALYEQTTRYRRVLLGAGMLGGAAVEAHQELMELTLSRAEDAAATALERHIGITTEAVLRALEGGRA
jgi:GntR family carbon starvation induced transcriptional regulator